MLTRSRLGLADWTVSNSAPFVWQLTPPPRAKPGCCCCPAWQAVVVMSVRLSGIVLTAVKKIIIITSISDYYYYILLRAVPWDRRFSRAVYSPDNADNQIMRARTQCFFSAAKWLKFYYLFKVSEFSVEEIVCVCDCWPDNTTRTDLHLCGLCVFWSRIRPFTVLCFILQT